MNCDEARELLSPFFDGQLCLEESAALSAHVDKCADCAKELRDYAAMSELTAESAIELPPNQWDRIQDNLDIPDDNAAAPNDIGLTPRRRRVSRRILVGLTAVIVVAVAIVVGPHLLHNHDEMAVNFDRYLDAYAKDPDRAADMLFAEYPAEEVDLDAAAPQVGYRPVVANGLPNGYSVVSTHILNMPCCKCVKTICSNPQGRKFVIFEHDAEQPMWFGDRRKSKCDCGGVPTSVVEFDGQLAGTWRVGKRSVTLVGASDIKQIKALVKLLNESGSKS